MKPSSFQSHLTIPGRPYKSYPPPCHRPPAFGLLINLGLAMMFWLAIVPFSQAGNEQDRFFHLPSTSGFRGGLISLGQATVCDTYYLHAQTKAVGADGTRRIATTTQPGLASPSAINNTLPLLSSADVEIARFYSDPVGPITYPLMGDIGSALWLQSTDFSNTTFTVTIFDYNPANGNLINLGDIEFIIITDGQNEVDLVITPPAGASLITGHRLLLILSARSPVLTAPTVTLYYDSPERASKFTACHPTPPQLTISKEAPAGVITGQPISYTLTVGNSGELAATNLRITDTLPTGSVYASGGTLIGNKVTWSVGSLAPHSSLQRSFAVTANQTLTNDSYQVQADGNFSAVGSEPVVTYVSAPGQPLLLISKSAPAKVRVNEPITYLLTVTNEGDTTVSDVQIRDHLPSGAVYVSGGTLTGSDVTWTINAPLAPQTSVQRSFVVRADKTITNNDYQASGSPTVLAVGQKAITTEVTPWPQYLPVTLKSAPSNQQTTLIIKSINTDGIAKIRVLQADNNSELLICTNIGNNVTVTCGSFKAVGSYKLIAITNRCGMLQGTFNDALAGATVTRQIFCN